VRVLLLYTDAPWYEGMGYDAAWRAALEAEGATVEQLPRAPERWYREGPPARELDLVIAHVLAEEVVGTGETLRAAALLETAGAPLLNPVAALVASADKLATHAVWAAAGVPQPRTWALNHLAAWPVPDGELVVKPNWGDGARGIATARTLDEAREHASGDEALVQERAAEPDVIRIFATPDAASRAYEKHREPGELLTHGTTYPREYDPPDDLAQLARRMVATLGGGLMGVDVLRDADGALWALEANGPFGFDVTDPAQGRWVARAALDRAERRAQARRAAAA
jgi:glutathione synthase/RimK-type ligase-like ATP-grasp enzyme